MVHVSVYMVLNSHSESGRFDASVKLSGYTPMIPDPRIDENDCLVLSETDDKIQILFSH
uniref:Uncharacterized protein n=1 Tax=Arion vulgaris TaxID=1028688 RepID=A0A0B6YQZ3_9EUPU